jgi:hypothetical protein
MCSGGSCWMLDGDLTGSVVTSDGPPLAVFAGHGCTYMPFNEPACDHLEEMMLPVETWGTRVVMTALTHPLGSGVAPSNIRVMALDSGTTVSFDPAVHGTETLGAGEFVEFATDQDFLVDASGPILAWQAVYGQQATGSPDDGDPAMGLGIPQQQVRDRYDFLVPSTYEANHVNVVAPQGTEVILGTSTISGWQAIGTTGFVVARVSLGTGPHHIESTDGTGFAITTYGYADWTSYLYPGGMNLTR